MTLHIFNPEHDIALACNLARFTPPMAARRLYADIGFMPAIWADAGDVVLVDDKSNAAEAFMRLREHLHGAPFGRRVSDKDVTFMEGRDVADLDVDGIDVWGWDAAICSKMLDWGLRADLLPGNERLADIRSLSHRRNVISLLEHVRTGNMVGEAFVCREYNEVERLLAELNHIVVKAPWSCSGRGIRFVDGNINAHQAGWIKNMLKAQGSLVVEPYYRKVVDFGMEFVCEKDGTVRYLGLSLFETDNWAYTGSVLATEEYKVGVITKYIPLSWLECARAGVEKCLGRIIKGRYCGPLGIDMMIVDDDGEGNYKLHPCVEINLRRTMGHAAMMLSPEESGHRGLMRIEYINNKYQLKINSL